METVAVILALLGTGFGLTYIGKQFKTTDEGGNKYGAVMKILFNTMSYFTFLTVPFAALTIADSVSVPGMKQVVSAAIVPIGFLTIIYVFYLLWSYLDNIIELMSGRKNQMNEQM